jgi:UPF0716 protein FxsA
MGPGKRLIETLQVPILLLLLLGLPLIEVYLMIRVGSVIGALPTIGLSILTAVLGVWLVRVQGVGLLLRVQRQLAQDELPALELLDGALILVAGFLLLLPGFLTDTVGFLLLVPPLRHWLIRRFVQLERVRIAGHPQVRRQGEVIEGRFRRED